MKGESARSAWVEVPGGRLYLERFGAGPPLLLVHGWALDHRMFRPQWRGLADTFEVIVFDRRGFGRSTAPPDLRRESADLDRLLDTLALDHIHLLGMSQGGRIALRYAAERAGRLRSLLLQGPVIDGFEAPETETERIPIDEYAALARRGALDTFRERWAAHPMMSLAHAPPASRRLVREVLADYEGRDLVAFDPAQYAQPAGLLDRLSTFPHPVLILTGELETEARQAHAARLLATLPHAREVRLPRSGHLCNLVAPEAYNEEVRTFCLAADSR